MRFITALERTIINVLLLPVGIIKMVRAVLKSRYSEREHAIAAVVFESEDLTLITDFIHALVFRWDIDKARIANLERIKLRLEMLAKIDKRIEELEKELADTKAENEN